MRLPRWPRRTLALLLLAALVLGCGRWAAWFPPAEEPPPAPQPEAITLYERALRDRVKASSLPLIDVGVSLAEWEDADHLVREMDRAEVALAAVTSPREEAVWEAVAKHPGRLIPLTTEVPERLWARPDEALLAALRRQLDRGARAIGPVRGGGLAAAGDAGRLRREALEALLRLAAERRAPLLLDLLPEDADVGQLERLLSLHPNAQVVWAETGHLPRVEMNLGYGHALLRAMSLRHANLSFALTALPPPEPTRVIRPRRNLLYDPGGRVSSEWAGLLNSRVEYFLSGGSPGSEGYAERMAAFRRHVLEALSPDARPAIAYRNAWRLLAGREWKE